MSIAAPVGGINLRYKVSFEHDLRNHLQAETFDPGTGVKVMPRKNVPFSIGACLSACHNANKKTQPQSGNKDFIPSLLLPPDVANNLQNSKTQERAYSRSGLQGFHSVLQTDLRKDPHLKHLL